VDYDLFLRKTTQIYNCIQIAKLPVAIVGGT